MLEIWNRCETIVDNVFAYNVALEIVNENEDHEPKSVEECRRRKDWPMERCDPS